jgi:SAM-dependent methyltransferase
MPMRDLIPDSLKSALRPPYYFVRRNWLYWRPKPLNVIHDYWRSPDELNNPRCYLSGEERSRFLVQILKRYVPIGGSLLELGCNVGRNLNEAYAAGYRNLEAIEINQEAIEIFKQSYPDTARVANIHLGRIEDHIGAIEEKDCIFTMAVLVHIHPSSDWIFAEIARRAKTLVVVEEEQGATWRHFARNYKKLFENLGMRQVEVIQCNQVPELVHEEGISDYVARVFRK